MSDQPYNLKQGGVADRYLARPEGSSNAKRRSKKGDAAKVSSRPENASSKESVPTSPQENHHAWQPTRTNWVPDENAIASPTTGGDIAALPVTPPDPFALESEPERPGLPFHAAWVDDRKGLTPRKDPTVDSPSTPSTEEPRVREGVDAALWRVLGKGFVWVQTIALAYAEVVLWWWGCVYSVYIFLFSLIAPWFLPPASAFTSLKFDGAAVSSSVLRRSAQHDLISKSASDMARMLRDGNVSSSTLVEACIARVREVNPVINAAVAERFEAARAEAREADKRLNDARAWRGREGERFEEFQRELPPLLGVPFSCKESFQLQGMPNTAGLVSRSGVVSAKDATVVKRVRAAGAIAVCSSNVSELCMWSEAYNRVYGLTRNPYSPRHSAGGSSGGEGALVAASAVPFGLGSDVAGSIRFPAAFTGTFGHKPTGGLVPNQGQHPCAHGDAARVLTTGPIARYARDLMPLLRVMASPCAGEASGVSEACLDSCEARAALADPALDLTRLRVVSVATARHLFTRSVTPEVRARQEDAAAALEFRGATLQREETLPFLARALEIWGGRVAFASIPDTEGDTEGEELQRQFREYLFEARSEAPRAWPLFSELWRLCCGRSPHTLPALALALIECIPTRLLELAGGRRANTQLRAQAEEALDALLTPGAGEDAVVVLFPAYPSPAPRHFAAYLHPFDFVYSAVWSALEMPATHVPLGLSASGLPLGVQVIAPRGRDALAIAVAMELEKDGVARWESP